MSTTTVDTTTQVAEAIGMAGGSLTAYFVFTVLVVTGVLIWGLRSVGAILAQPIDPAKPAVTFGMSALAEKSPDTPATSDAPGPFEGSFSRVGGAIGTIVLAVVFLGVGYFVFGALFFGGKLGLLKEVWPWFMAGSAFYAPYAFNQLSAIFHK